MAYTVWYRNTFDSGTAVKGSGADRGSAVRNVHAFEPSAVIESIISYLCESLGEGYVTKALVSVKDVIVELGYSCRNGDIRYTVAVQVKIICR